MIYRLAWIIVKVALWVSLRKIKLTGVEKIPKDMPIIFTSNHPMGFIEPLIIATQIPKIFFYLARGDYFESKTASWWLGQINIYPIFRFRDGFQQMRHNESAISNVTTLLKQGKSFMVFVEGSTKLQRSYRQVQKGASRLMYDILVDDPEMKIAIVPIGFNASDMISLNSEFHVDVGAPIYANTLFQREKSKPRFLKTLTQKIQNASEALVPQVHSSEDEVLMDLAILQSVQPVSLTMQKDIAAKINLSTAQNKQTAMKMLMASDDLMKSHGISSYSIKHSPSLIDYLMCILLAIPFFLSYLFHALPFSLAKGFTDRKIVNPAFYTIIRFVSNLILIVIWYLIMIPLVVYFFGLKGILVLLVVAICGKYNHQYSNLWRMVKDHLLHKEEIERIRSADGVI